MIPPRSAYGAFPQGAAQRPAEAGSARSLDPVAKRGLLLFAHGARDPNWALPFEAVAGRARAQEAEVEVRLAFLEFMSPDLPEAGRQLAEAGCTRVDVVPLFLGAGGHVRKDLPALLERLRAGYAAVEWVLRPAVGETDAVIEAMAATSVAWLRDPARP